MKPILHILILSALILVSCRKDPDPVPDTPKDLGLKAGSELVIESMNDFGLDIFRLILADEPENKNVFISPTSLSLALAMTLNGANTTTEDSMAYALRMDHLTPDQINETFRDLIAALVTCDERVLLEIANSIWYRQGYPVEPDFLEVNMDYFDAEVGGLDFASPGAVDAINDWVSTRTHDKIPTILNQIDPETIMFLINAIYFKGSWSIEFDENETQNGTFHLADGSTKTVPMMHLDNDIGYFQNELFQACELNYGRGNFSMMIFLPGEEVPMEDFIAQMTPENWASWTESFYTTETQLTLPKFRFEYEKMLNEILGMMGMGIAFDGVHADFSGINPDRDLYISYVKHKTFVEVNEEGTEAAAVTVVAINELSAGGNFMFVDRPFVFAIREKTTNTVLFMGRVGEPK